MTSPSGPTIDNSLDDIFGSSPPHEPSRIPEHEPAPTDKSLSSVEPSELPFLRRQHVTAGYRDGISTSKGEHVQEGFDAGFPVGAQLGMRAGTVIGILEGVLRGYESRAASAVVKKLPGRTGAGATAAGTRKKGEEGQGGKELDEEARRARREEVLKLYQSAVKALNVQGVFGTLEEGGEDGEGKPSPETQLAGKGDGVVSKWENRVHVAHWEENMDVLQMKEEEGSESQAQAQGQDEGAEVAGSLS
ncbi:Yae1 family protein [Aspergillus melleus]|uniref:Yae1 family protein n=1 Tax=Aspergillus melleus TaxID=138277 RepID=UPI001E8D4A0F|nr:Essential protein Yae1, N terminal [Aspergillus melleus]KAH8426613.1 Essential protein Yae1, N terminal [Aspergillus melleus]